ncbi:MAG: DNA primase [Alphaproteobacteria bacterium RIFCSPHIGHO2_12_FULL_45_9]|nr:MAG: DNA primase [Alphaproteobacteria bacterium RIFCSPHIGHO2_12_FULL_45_9]
MSFSPRFTQDLRDRLTLSEIIGRRVKLVRAGREFKGCCPFHREKSPSFYVNDEKQFYHCFGCGAHGDAVGFVMQHDNLSFPEAIELLATQVGMEVPKQSFEDKEYSKKEKSLYALCDESAKWFEAQLHDPKNKEVLNYISGRGLSSETLNAFRLGYAPSDDQALRKVLLAQGFTDAQMIEAGVLKLSTTQGREPYGFFRDRLIFPVADARGRIVAFGGRVLPDHLRPPQRGDFKPPKYINSADTPLFHKGRTLYAGQHARLSAKEHKLIVVEGYMDVIACHQAGFRGAVAPLGTALTEEQISLLWKMIPLDEKEPVLCFDGDEAGYRAAVRAVERVLPLLKPQQSVRIAFLPECEDPDTFIREKGTGAFEKLVNNARSLVDFLWSHQIAGKKFDTPESRAGLAAKLDELATQIPEGQLQYYYKQMFRDKMREFLGNSWKDFKGKKSKTASLISLPSVGQKKAETMIPQIMLLTVLNHPDIYPYIASEFHRLELGTPELENLYHHTVDILENNLSEEEDDIDSATLLNQLKEHGLSDFLDDFLKQERLYMHAGFARPGEKIQSNDGGESGVALVVSGWKSLWNQWSKSVLMADIMAARLHLAQNMTPENESRMLALKQAVDDLGK